MTDTLQRLDVFVAGKAAPQGSKRHMGKGVMLESSKHVKPWRSDIRDHIAEHYTGPKLLGPLTVELEFIIQRPKSHYRTGRNSHLLRDSSPALPTSKPDLDKLIRAVLDAIGSVGTVWHDDAQVVELRPSKRYTVQNESPGVLIGIEQLHKLSDDELVDAVISKETRP